MADFIYEQVHYPSVCYAASQPAHLELVAWLFGMRPRAATEARVLEIGCASGGNLLPLAERYPDAHFVGIDLSASQIAAGQKVVDAVGLKNVELRALDLTKLDASFGEFDYISAHGVYSWVPPAVADALLALIGKRLAPHGVAMISHNVKPGWHMKAIAAEMMRYHVRNMPGAAEHVAQARNLLNVMVHAARPDEKLYRAILAEQLEASTALPDFAFFHDDLADFCDGCYFWELAARAKQHGLAYLADSNVELMFPNGYDPRVVAMLGQVTAASGDIVEREQYLDFLSNRRFRNTLLRRADVPVDHDAAMASWPAKVAELWLTANVRPEGETVPDPRDPGPVTFSSDFATALVKEPLTKVALFSLTALWPRPISFAEVCARAAHWIGSPLEPAWVYRVLARELAGCFTGGAVQLSRRAPSFVGEPGPLPRTTGVNRHMAATGGAIASLSHIPVELDELHLRVLALLDGKRDRAALASASKLDAEQLEAVLVQLGRMAVLVS